MMKSNGELRLSGGDLSEVKNLIQGEDNLVGQKALGDGFVYILSANRCGLSHLLNLIARL